MQEDNKVFKWIVVIILVVVLCGMSGVVSEIPDINARSARYLILAIIFFSGILLVLYEIRKISLWNKRFVNIVDLFLYKIVERKVNM